MAALEGGGNLRVVGKRREDRVEEELPASASLRALWRAVSSNAALLKNLIEASPIRNVAASFGVSDVAVHKACTRLGIEKKQRGES